MNNDRVNPLMPRGSRVLLIMPLGERPLGRGLLRWNDKVISSGRPRSLLTVSRARAGPPKGGLCATVL